jgi:prevent-host-death family protein
VTTMSHMPTTVGVRELRRDLSRYLRRVERGESFAVTSRGRAVAVLGPTPEQRDPVARLVMERDAIPARLELLDVEPLELPGGPPLSELLEDVRADRL